jgi:hypothetical protein
MTSGEPVYASGRKRINELHTHSSDYNPVSFCSMNSQCNLLLDGLLFGIARLFKVDKSQLHRRLFVFPLKSEAYKRKI